MRLSIHGLVLVIHGNVATINSYNPTKTSHKTELDRHLSKTCSYGNPPVLIVEIKNVI